jgi:hypothetical protein
MSLRPRSLLLALTLVACSPSGGSDPAGYDPPSFDPRRNGYNLACYASGLPPLSAGIEARTAAATWLTYSEGRRTGNGDNAAHTIAKHVGKTDDQLRQRFTEEGIAKASTFTDLATAERVVDDVIRARQSEIALWALDPASNRQFTAVGTCAGGCGRTLSARGEPPAYPAEATVFLFRECEDGAASFFVNTSFPGRL